MNDVTQKTKRYKEYKSLENITKVILNLFAFTFHNFWFKHWHVNLLSLKQHVSMNIISFDKLELFYFFISLENSTVDRILPITIYSYDTLSISQR